MPKELYRLTDAEHQIFERAASNPNLFTNWYLRSDRSGTYADVNNTDPRYVLLHKALLKRWLKLDRPRKFDFTYSLDEVPLAPLKAVTGQVFMRGLVMPTVSCPVYVQFTQDGKLPSFFVNHGFWSQDWQLEMMQLPQDSIVLIGGYGCLAADAKIWDVELGREVAVEELVRQQRAPVVLAWDGNHFVPIRASIPWIKGEDDLYEVTTASGRKITTTLQHKFLTSCGWMTLEQVASQSTYPDLLMSADDLQESSQGISPSELRQDVPHYSHTILNSQDDYHLCCRFYGGQPQFQVNNDLTVFPSPNDAPSHIPPWFGMGDRVIEYKCSPADETRLSHLSKSHSAHLSGHPVLPQGYFYYEGIGASVPSSASLRVSRAPQEYDGNSYPHLQSDVFDLQTDGTDSAFFSSNSPFGVEPKPPISIEPVLSICKVGAGAFYDIHVPIYENYLAEGFINHNSSKTSLASIDMLIKAATLPGFAGFVIAPGSIASTAVYEDKWIGRMSGTLYEKRFLVRNLRKQPQEIGIGNDYVGYSSVKFYSVHDNQDKIKNIEGDMAHIDQAEQLQDISTMNGNVGSRLRGNFQGRNRVGKIYWIANPNDTPDLWNMADDSIEHPQFTYYKQISTYENWALSEDDIRRFERKVGKTENERNSNLFGFRPIGDGKQFSGESIKNCLSTDLDDKMNAGLAANKLGYLKEDAPRIGIWKWELPYEEGHTYVVIADPGQDSPPNRNAAAIGVWDITGFPDSPAQMTAFHWVFGNNSPLPWMTSFFDYVERYKAVGRCGYDSTGWQSGYLQWVETFAKIQSTGMNMNQSNKYMHLNSAKQLMNRALIKYPTIQMLTSQLAKYDMPEPNNLIQDIVVMIMLTCTWLQQYFYLGTRTDEHQISIPVDRHVWRPTSRASASRR